MIEQETYKGYSVYYNVVCDKWIAQDSADNEIIAENQSRPMLLKMIDKLEKTKFERFEVIYDKEIGIITSINFDGAWISYKNKERKRYGMREKLAKYDIPKLRAATEINIEKLNQIASMKEEIETLEDKIRELGESMEPLNKEQIELFSKFNLYNKENDV